MYIWWFGLGVLGEVLDGGVGEGALAEELGAVVGEGDDGAGGAVGGGAAGYHSADEVG